MYTATLHGVHPYFEVGDKYELNVYYQLPTMTLPTELIAVDVEVRGVSIARDFDGIGQTALSLRVPSGAWNKTTAIRAAMLATGLPYDKINRSTVLTVGAYDYPGPADIYCDGTADNVQIQAAIDQLYAIGGGDVYLTRGNFKTSAIITLRDKVNIIGSGSTKIRPQDITKTSVMASAGADCVLSNFTISGEDVTYANRNLTVITEASVPQKVRADNVTIANFTVTASTVSTTYSFWGMVGIKSASNCIIEDISLTLTTADGIDFYGFASIETTARCIIRDIDGTSSEGTIRAFLGCTNITGCILQDCTLGTGTITAFYSCNNISASSMHDCDGYFTTCAYQCTNLSCISSSSNAASYTYYGYNSCTNITVSSSLTNTAGTTEIGFLNCKSVQQCKTDDANKYGAGVGQSYADAGTSNACADTAAGGYNS
jgi:hypothetical protein